jgi:hypothetical protein
VQEAGDRQQVQHLRDDCPVLPSDGGVGGRGPDLLPRLPGQERSIDTVKEDVLDQQRDVVFVFTIYLAVFYLFEARVLESDTQASPPPRQLWKCTLRHNPEPEFLNIYWRLKSRHSVESCLFNSQSVLCTAGLTEATILCVLYFKDVNSLKKQKNLTKRHFILHFTLKISADLFGSLEIKLSAQPSFENL